jgi:hypothetical protein
MRQRIADRERSWPTRNCDESANVAGVSAASVCTTAMVVRDEHAAQRAACPRPSESVTTNRDAPATTCALVTTFPRASKTTPEPSPLSVSICTTEGIAIATARSYTSLTGSRSERRPGFRAGRSTGAGEKVTTVAASVASSTATAVHAAREVR